jgi:hypothetical protein
VAMVVSSKTSVVNTLLVQDFILLFLRMSYYQKYFKIINEITPKIHGYFKTRYLLLKKRYENSFILLTSCCCRYRGERQHGQVSLSLLLTSVLLT